MLDINLILHLFNRTRHKLTVIIKNQIVFILILPLLLLYLYLIMLVITAGKALWECVKAGAVSAPSSYML